jgi:hypothetical protein
MKRELVSYTRVVEESKPVQQKTSPRYNIVFYLLFPRRFLRISSPLPPKEVDLFYLPLTISSMIVLRSSDVE